MKKIKYIIIGFVLGLIVIGSISVYAVEAVIESKEVSYDNKSSHGSFEEVQGSIDELYERSGVMKQIWKDPILHGADPVFDSTNKMIPVEINRNGTVKYANLYTKWYEYEDKRWANAVILVDSPSKSYKTGDTIAEADIESYFVWIPRYKYKIWDLGNYDKVYIMGNLTDTKEGTGNDETSLRNITGKARLIDIEFGDTTEVQKMEENQAQLNKYYTHPAFTLGDVNLNRIWVGKFETGYNQMPTVGGSITTSGWTTIGANQDVIASNKIIVKPNVYSWRNQTVDKIFNTALGYESSLGSHMMKNTEWGAVAYLSHSVYGIGTEVNINNNSDFKTGYSAAANTDQSSYPGTTGTDTINTKAWNTSTGYLASTTGNITGVYDMSGGAWEYMAAYIDGKPGASELSLEELNNVNNTKYFDKYSASSNMTSYNLRIMGDATGEMGPFYDYYDKDIIRTHNAWYADYSHFVYSASPWFNHGGGCTCGVIAGQFYFDRGNGSASSIMGSRLVLAVN